MCDYVTVGYFGIKTKNRYATEPDANASYRLRLRRQETDTVYR